MYPEVKAIWAVTPIGFKAPVSATLPAAVQLIAEELQPDNIVLLSVARHQSLTAPVSMRSSALRNI